MYNVDCTVNIVLYSHVNILLPIITNGNICHYYCSLLISSMLKWYGGYIYIHAFV